MTGSTDGVRARARERRAASIAANPGRLCPPEHSHGATTTCITNHGCRCVPCVKSRAEVRRPYDRETRRMQGYDVDVPALGAERRLQALAVAGWSCPVLADMSGMHYRPLMKIRAGERSVIRASTHRRIDALYRKLCMTPADSHSADVTRGQARDKGYLPALAWDDIDLDTAPPAVDDDGPIVDMNAVRLAADGVPVKLNHGERREAVALLHGRRMIDSHIARTIGTYQESVFRIRKELGLEAVA